MKLPLELRYKIYEFAVIAKGPVRLTTTASEAKEPGLALLRASRQVYRECIPFFYRNNFKISDMAKDFIPFKESIAKNVQEITFEWWGFSKKDVAT
jgi:hypothetical protein